MHNTVLIIATGRMLRGFHKGHGCFFVLEALVLLSSDLKEGYETVILSWTSASQ